MSVIIQLLLGLLFGTGLVVAGMSNPQKVLNFLDIAAIASDGWDPSLAFVLGGAVITTFIGYRLVLKRGRPLFDTQFHLPKKTAVDLPLLTGAAIFGVGWGLAGFCPGPAFTGLGSGSAGAMTFVAAMLVGMAGARRLARNDIKAAAAA